MKTIHVVVAFIMCLTISCTRVIMTVYGIHDPEVMNETKINTYLEKKGLSTTDVLAIKSEGYLETLDLIGKSFPEILVFNEKGQPIKYKNKEHCNANAFAFIDSLNTSHEYEILKDAQGLPDHEKNFTDLAGNRISLAESEADFTLLIFWTEWTGRLNKNHTLIWKTKADNNSNCKIKTYKVNCDFQEFWEEEEREEIITSFSRE